MYSFLRRFAWLGMVALLAAACQRNLVYLSTPTGNAPGTAVPERAATLLEAAGTVETRTSENAAWTPAVQGQLFSEGSQLRTAPGARAVIGLTEGSRIYVDESTETAITLLNPYLDSQLTVLDLKSGRLWVLLSSGSLDVQTPFGIATGRATNGAANLSAEYLPDSRTVNITCLQGICGFGSILIPSGYKLANAATNESPEPMEMADLGAWGQAVPEATQLAYLGTEAAAQGSATLPVVASSTPTPTATPTASATETQLPTSTETPAPETPSSTPEPPTATLEPSLTPFPSPTEPIFQPTVTPRPFTPLPPVPLIGHHTAQPGDTIFCIARAYGVLPVAIAQANGLSFTSFIRSGQVLAIPAVQWLDILDGPVCAAQFVSPYPGLVVATATPADTATPAGPPLNVSVVANCAANCDSSQGSYTIHVDVFAEGGIGPYSYNPAQSFDVEFPHCTDSSDT
ncbi:MAG: LysM peptidoglycan-binding domain-containing protein, partial [Anaerolineales bacterium]